MECFMIDYRQGTEWYRVKGALGTVAYRSLEKAREKVKYYLENFDEAFIVQEKTVIIPHPTDDECQLVVRTYCRVQ